MATLVSFWSFLGDRMANLGLIDFKLGLYINVNMNTGQNKFKVFISNRMGNMPRMDPKLPSKCQDVSWPSPPTPSSKSFFPK